MNVVNFVVVKICNFGNAAITGAGMYTGALIADLVIQHFFHVKLLG